MASHNQPQTRRLCTGNCGKLVITYKDDPVCRECRRNARTKACLHCGKSFDHARPALGQVYCSDDCDNLARVKVHRKKCEGCGQEFTVSGNHARRQKTCGQIACRYAWRKAA